MSSLDFHNMPLRSLVELRDRVAEELRQRFEKTLALLFTDVVGSAAYVAQHGDLAGRDLLKRHRKLLDRALAGTSGRIIDTAGDGAFCVADGVDEGAEILVSLQRLLAESNAGLASAHHLHVRSGLHYGRALVDDLYVTGAAVQVAARIMGTAGSGEIRLGKEAFRKLPARLRPFCRRLEPQSVKGVPEPVDIFVLDWRDPERFPADIELVGTDSVIPIPYRSRIAIGRLAEHDGKPANDIVLNHPDSELMKCVSRWHVELEMTTEGYQLRANSRAATEVDGQLLEAGQKLPIKPGSVVRLGNAVTLLFRPHVAASDATVLSKQPTPVADRG